MTAALTPAERRAIESALDAIERARDAIEKAIAPFREQLAALDEAEGELLDRHGLGEPAGKCEGCGRRIFRGEQAYSYSEGELVCAEDAPTWRDLKQTLEETPGAFEEAGDIREVIAAREADGTLDEKCTWEV